MLNIDIVADIVCPWCFIGKRRLETAIELVRRELPNFEYSTCWRPFFLNPDTPPEGEPYLPFLEQKFGGPAAVEALFERVREAGRAYGIDYAFEKISLRANTFQAHRLLYWAQQHGSADALIERLFVAQFQRGEQVGGGAVLVNIAAECGYPAAEVAAYLTSTADAALVLADAQEIRAMGVRMVPTFILEDQHVIVGAEDPAVLANAILQLAGAAK
ncbi:DsbA family oxidoreductase [Dechloromonas sp. TW-R-39-2]|uniref:DsbA family oxidoreductase n=1 Tax=Dechloromonas sp. TW-R-39-2 TaxID=2654218 RepID=UPI00193E1532|nr:DsbA family oxidoreductase [Dechloromonas sp. TW-R-39-2]QRM19807.1 DsbA family oxidoreductase [Dechloromonas sp. TW-R-39-2]